MGAIFLIIGFILLMVGLFQGVNAMNTISQLYGQYLGDYANELRSTIFWSVAGNYIIGSLMCFVVGGVGLVAGRTKTVGGETVTLSQPTPMVANTSQIKCGSCGTMNDIDAVFCKKCGNNLR